MNALIVTGGSTDLAFARERIEKEKYDLTIAADSGMRFFYETGICPHLVAGDFDSADPKMLEFFEQDPRVEVIRLNPIKDDTDTEFAIRRAISLGATKIDIFGGTGSRLDHVLGNLTLLGIGPETGTEICIMDPHNRIRMINAPITLSKEKQYGRFISLLPFAGDVCGLTLRGMKYPLTDYTMGGFNSLGISNEITEEEATISMTSGYLLVIESKD